MFNDAQGLKSIYLACGYTDLRRGIDGFKSIIRFQFRLDPFDKGTLFLFCGKQERFGRSSEKMSSDHTC